ncbi:HD domain-containing protein [Zavarzinia sp. CC-PAN008]|uniref:HD domain-containing protein n=1 Tax=Zavarzinia sp. CC-PAN008 TaxID=3243332 RepID=UPI003F746514
MSDAANRLVARWRSLARRLALPERVAAAAERSLGDGYGAATRHYHDAGHIVAMLDGLDAVRADFREPDTAELATVFHDVVYDASRADNEERSAALMRAVLDGHLAPAVLDKAAAMILATQRHQATGDADTDLLLDLDMAILGQDWPVYRRYALGVMREYVPVFGEAGYRAGRPERFLEPTAAHGQIFLTDRFRPLNDRAIANMRKEAALLRSGADLDAAE